LKTELRLCLESIAKAVSTQTGIALERINVFVEPCVPERSLAGDGNLRAVVHVAASVRNGRAGIQNIMRTACSSICDQTRLSAGQVAAYAHPIEQGYLFVGETFL
jgi:hypothetical protein